jgi:hypothetical protein
MTYFCCVKCVSLMSLERARKLFRTGYYRVDYHLGCCTACFPEFPAPAAAQESSISENI